MELRKATRQKAKLKIGLAGPAGSGKTYSALLLASGMTDWSKIAVIDTENKSADLYSHLGDYNVLTLEAPFSPERYIEAIKTCESSGIEVIIIDSITHEWAGKGGCLEIHGSMAGNSFANWARVTPRHNAFIDAIIQSNCHIITTVRKKQDYEMSKDSQGKTEVVKVGLQEQQRDGYSYEVTLNFDISIDHYAKADKDRTLLFMDKPPIKITSEVGHALMEWANKGVDAFEPSKESILPDPIRELNEEMKKRGAKDSKHAAELLNSLLSTKFKDIYDLNKEQAFTAISKLQDLPF